MRDSELCSCLEPKWFCLDNQPFSKLVLGLQRRLRLNLSHRIRWCKSVTSPHQRAETWNEKERIGFSQTNSSTKAAGLAVGAPGQRVRSTRSKAQEDARVHAPSCARRKWLDTRQIKRHVRLNAQRRIRRNDQSAVEQNGRNERRD